GVAEAAGVSVGSLYQYFPNKEAVLFAVHSRRIETAWSEVQVILDSRDASARERIRRVAMFFFLAESDDVKVLGEAAHQIEHYLGDDVQHRELYWQVERGFRRFVREAMPPGASRSHIEFSSQLIMTVIDGVGRNIATQQLPESTLVKWASVVADMLADFTGLP